MEFKPQDPNYEIRVQESFKRQQVNDFIGAEIFSLKPGYCEIHLPFKNELSQQHGFFHAGIIATIADTAGGYAAFSLMPEEATVLTVEYKINLIGPAEGSKAMAHATVVKPGRTLTVCNVQVFVKKNNTEKLCAVTQMTVMCLKGKSDSRQ